MSVKDVLCKLDQSLQRANERDLARVGEDSVDSLARQVGSGSGYCYHSFLGGSST